MRCHRNCRKMVRRISRLLCTTRSVRPVARNLQQRRRTQNSAHLNARNYTDCMRLIMDMILRCRVRPKHSSARIWARWFTENSVWTADLNSKHSRSTQNFAANPVPGNILRISKGLKNRSTRWINSSMPTHPSGWTIIRQRNIYVNLKPANCLGFPARLSGGMWMTGHCHR